MEPGIFERTFPRPTLEATLDAVAAHGIRHIQLDLASAGLGSMPAHIPDAVATRIHDATSERGIAIAAVSGTWNMVHPDPTEREAGLAGLRAIAGACDAMGSAIITLCTGTRDPDSMWRRHPDNDTPEAWRDLVATMSDALAIADAHDVVLAFEPEPANVISSAARGRDLLAELAHPRLKVVMDAANVVATDRSRPPEAVLDEAFALLGEQIVVAHGKDLSAGGAFCAAGSGIVPWDRVVARLQAIGFDGPVILHSLSEDEVPASLAFMRGRIAGATP
jgi:sugar phosphate isomerase/epimerase